MQGSTKNNSIVPFEHLLSEQEKQQIIDNSNTVLYNKKEIIFRQNTRTSHIMFIKSGMVKIFKEGRNKKFIILKVAVQQDFLGLLSIYGRDTHQYSASAAVPTEICFIDIGVFNKILFSNGEFAERFINKICNDGLYIFERLMSQSHKQLPGRIADVILYFAERIFKADEFEFPFTRRELAELAGTTKESFIRTLAEFKNDKIIDLDGSNVKINSLKIVKTLSQLG
ncbi:MAG: Crp/Fnr family transcriptional regulator [Bacteroidales bacterium]|nr:Crp/Fnr family transcriptional regulator [Bacteroidales bacterium]MBN2820170.1 Crp/Fnr family transcriptional regulator [Bacteroidales bacterium]